MCDLYWLSADVITEHILKHDGCCGADSGVAGANGGCHTITASVSMIANVQENCYLHCGFYLKFYWCLNDYLLSSATVSHDFYVWRCATYTLVSFMFYLYDIMKCFVRNDEIKLWNQTVFCMPLAVDNNGLVHFQPYLCPAYILCTTAYILAI